MAATNGYTVRQSGDWYISDGDQIDWMYGRHRIFSFTVELYPPEGSTSLGGHYPPDEKIARQTARNRAALLYLIDLADCPYRASGTQVANCGPLYDDLELQPRLDAGSVRRGHGDASAGAMGAGQPGRHQLERPEAARDGRLGIECLRHRPSGRELGHLVRPRWPNVDRVARDRLCRPTRRATAR